MRGRHSSGYRGRQEYCLMQRERQRREFLYRSSARQRQESKASPSTADLLQHEEVVAEWRQKTLLRWI